MNAEPFSYEIAAYEIPGAGKRYRIEADAEARRRLAAALDIPEIVSLTAEVEAKPLRGGEIAVRGVLSASVVQTDVVTLDPVGQEVQQDIDVTLERAEGAGRDRKGKGRRAKTAEAEERDTYRNGRIDLGAVVGEHLALGLDPYPKAPDAAFAGYIEDDPADDPSPFAALARLKERGG